MVNTFKVKLSWLVNLLTFFLGRLSLKAVDQDFLHILLSVTDNCPYSNLRNMIRG